MPARYLAVLDAGSTFLKLALFSQEEGRSQQLLASWIQPRLSFESSLNNLFAQAKDWLKAQDLPTEWELAVVGHYPEIPALASAKWKISHQDALASVAKRLSSTSGVVIIDIGSHRTLVAIGRYGKVSQQSFDLGVGVEAWNKVRRAGGLESVKQWITASMGDGAIENYLANKSMFSEIIPSSSEELLIEQSMGKAILDEIRQKLVIPWDDIDQVVLSGATLTQSPIATQGVGMLLDGLTPVGRMQLSSDQSLVLMNAGGAFEAWSSEDYRIGLAMLQQNLRPIGTVLGLDTPSGKKQKVAKVTLDLGLNHDQVLEVRGGDLLTLPLPADDQGSLTITGVSDKDDSHQAIGGEAGLVIDGRGRPLVLPEVPNQRHAQLLQWDRQLNAHGQYGTIGETKGQAA